MHNDWCCHAGGALCNLILRSVILISLTLRNRRVAVIVILESRSSISSASDRQRYQILFQVQEQRRNWEEEAISSKLKLVCIFKWCSFPFLFVFPKWNQIPNWLQTLWFPPKNRRIKWTHLIGPLKCWRLVCLRAVHTIMMIQICKLNICWHHSTPDLSVIFMQG